jgi:hypothetical protein
MSVSHITVVVNTVLHPLQLTAKILVTMVRNRTNIQNMIESNQLMNLIPKTLISKIECRQQLVTNHMPKKLA